MAVSQKKSHHSKRRSASTPRRSSAKHKKEKVLKSLYQDGRKRSDYRQLEKRSSSTWRAIFIFFFISAILAGGLAYYKQYGLPSVSLLGVKQGSAVITINAPESAAVLTPVSIEVAVSAPDAEQGSISVFIPDGFEIQALLPEPTERNGERELTWNLGQEDLSGAAPLSLVGMFMGPIDSYKSFRAIVTYKPLNFESRFQSNTSATIHISDSPVELSIEAPNTMTSGQEEIFELTITNTGSEQLNELNVQPPDVSGFETEQPPTLESLAAGETKTVEIKGSFSSEKNGIIKLPWSIVEAQTDTVVASNSHEVIVSSDPLLLELSLSKNPRYLAPGDLIRAELRYHNKSSGVLNDTELIVQLDSPSVNNSSILSWDYLETTGSPEVIGMQLSDQIRRGSISWDSQTLPTLKQIEPQSQGVISFSLPLLTSSQLDLTGLGASTFRISADLISGDQTAQAQPLTLPLVSDASLQAGAIKAGDLIVVQWTLNHHVHEISDIKINTKLFGGVSWADQTDVSDGDISYKTGSKEVAWIISRRSPTEGPATATFALRVQNDDPTQTAVIGESILTFKDAIASETISRSRPPLQKP